MSSQMQREQVLGFPIYTAFSPPGMVERALEVVKNLEFIKNQDNKMTGFADLHKKPELLELHGWFLESLHTVVEDMGLHYPKMEITCSWANCSARGEKHHRHSHNMAVISGIYYLTEGQGGNTVFVAYHNLWKQNVFWVPEQDLSFFEEMPEKGKLILFPSNLRHQVAPHEDEQPRYTIAFNAFPKGQFGSMAEKNYLEL